MLKELAPLRFELGSNSMWPLLKQGDRIQVRPLLEGEGVVLGQVVAFAESHRLICHRVIKEQLSLTRRYYTRGDVAFDFDRSRTATEYWGRVVVVEGAPFRSLFLGPLGRFFSGWARARDGAIKALGLKPGTFGFSLLFLAFFPWLGLRPDGPLRAGVRARQRQNA